MWGDNRGVEVAPVTNLANCASVTPRLLIPGGAEPFYSAGAEQPGLANPVQPGLKPVAAFGFAPARPTRGHAVSFNGTTSHEASGRITTWTWSFGDGHTARGAKVSHVFARAGSYTVTLTVTDGVGQHAVIRHRVVVG
jgi:PKD repeat protein